MIFLNSTVNYRVECISEVNKCHISVYVNACQVSCPTSITRLVIETLSIYSNLPIKEIIRKKWEWSLAERRHGSDRPSNCR